MEEAAIRALARALARTNRRWNALDRIVLPEIERDEAFRRRRVAGRISVEKPLRTSASESSGANRARN